QVDGALQRRQLVHGRRRAAAPADRQRRAGPEAEHRQLRHHRPGPRRPPAGARGVIGHAWRLAAGTAAAALLAGCGSSVAGQPAPTGTGSNPSTTSTTSSTKTSSSAPLTELTNTQLCGLLTATEATQLGGSDTGRPS